MYAVIKAKYDKKKIAAPSYVMHVLEEGGDLVVLLTLGAFDVWLIKAVFDPNEDEADYAFRLFFQLNGQERGMSTADFYRFYQAASEFWFQLMHIFVDLNLEKYDPEIRLQESRRSEEKFDVDDPIFSVGHFY